MLGQLEQIESRWRLRFTRETSTPSREGWRALVQLEHLDAWFPTTMEGDRVEGAELTLSFRENETPSMHGEMITYDPYSALEFKWGEDLIRFELRPESDGTVLTLFDIFDELGRAARDAAGWHVCLDLLDDRLAGAEPPADGGRSRWETVHTEYVEVLGPEAATIGPPEEFLNKS
jgi:uncharacterized protein YndB with AHSA1/START domain